jgi:hypothetical protein
MIRILLLVSLILISFSNARDLSCRMRAMGDDFALLIPDYETDVLYNPIFMTQSLFGVYFNTNEETPIKINFIYQPFGFYGFYWPNHIYHRAPSNNNDWYAYSKLNDRFKITFLMKIKAVGFSVTPDISRERIKYWGSTVFTERNIKQNFLCKSSVGLKLNNKFFLFVEPTLGFLEEFEKTEYTHTIPGHRIIYIFSGRLNALYRNIKEENRFISANLEIGGPTSLSDIEKLPISPFAYFDSSDTVILPFYNSFQANSGFCLGLPIDEKLMIAFGLKEKFDFQVVFHTRPYQQIIYLAINNKISYPITIEYKLNRIALRCGTNFFYNYSSLESGYGSYFEREISSQTRKHDLGYGFTFGLGWYPKEKLTIDLNYIGSGNILGLDNWSIYLKYLI